MKIGDEVQIRCHKFDPVEMETVETWRIGRVLSFDDFSFTLEFVKNHERESFPMAMLEERDARLIPISTFASMFYE
ncbi:MAG: hypothetical protein K0S71_604 [Clostridia bacterium]|jgi:hypothetical protein|nr:hypothetical protein [Clostridia bacterium]